MRATPEWQGTLGLLPRRRSAEAGLGSFHVVLQVGPPSRSTEGTRGSHLSWTAGSLSDSRGSPRWQGTGHGVSGGSSTSKLLGACASISSPTRYVSERSVRGRGWLTVTHGHCCWGGKGERGYSTSKIPG